MSFGRLFAASKNLIGGQSGRYRTDHTFLVPKFISPKNPFTQTTNKGMASGSAGSVEVPSQKLPPQAADAVARVAPTSKQTPTPNATRASAGERFTQWLGSLAQKLARRSQPRRSAIPRFGPDTAQPELHLEKIRVMGNDLSDADLEVVPAGATATKPGGGGTAWGQLATRVLGPDPH